MAKRWSYRAVFWNSPHYLDVPIGPWNDGGRGALNAVGDWRKCLDYLADLGFNMVISSVIPHFKTHDKSWWPFHYILDFAPYGDECAVFSPDFLDENRAMLNAIFSHAKSVGITPIISHYNFMIPGKVAFKIPALDEAWNYGIFPKSGKYFVDKFGLLLGNACWENTDYQQFMDYCWRQTFLELPDLGGYMVTPGEYNRCQCPKCRDSRTNMTLGLYQTVNAIAKSHGKIAICREWFGGDAVERVNNDFIFAGKVCEFDCQDTPLSPRFHKLAQLHKRVWGIVEYHGENAGWITWSSPEYFKKLFDEICQLNVEGVVLHQNPDMEALNLYSKLDWINFLNAANHLNKGTGIEPKVFLEKLFGPDSELADKILQCNADIVLNIGKMIHSRGEGHTFTAYYPFSEESSHLEVSFYQANVYKRTQERGLCGEADWFVPWTADFFAPDEWVRGNWLSISDYMEHFRNNDWREDYETPFAGKGVSPMLYMRNCANKGRSLLPQGKEISRRWQMSSCPDDWPLFEEWNILLNSLRTALAMADEFCAFAEAEIYKAAWQNPNNTPEIRIQLRQKIRKALQLTINAMEQQFEAAMRYPDCMINFRRDLQCSGNRGIDFHPLADRLEWRRAELAQFASMPALLR